MSNEPNETKTGSKFQTMDKNGRIIYLMSCICTFLSVNENVLPLPRLAPNRDAFAVRFDDMFHDGQTEPRTTLLA